MILHLINQNIFGISTKLFTVTNENDTNDNVITAITLDNAKLDMTKPETFDLAIEYVNDARIGETAEDKEAMRYLKDLSNVFGINNIDTIVNDNNDKIDAIINTLTSMKDSLICKTSSREKYFNIARRYMDEVIDPNNTMPSSEYNKMLHMFSMYNEWVMNR